MKKCEILQELWKCGTNIKWANAIGEVAAIDLLKEDLPQTFSLFKKKKKKQNNKKPVSTKWKKMKHACMQLEFDTVFVSFVFTSLIVF